MRLIDQILATQFDSAAQLVWNAAYNAGARGSSAAEARKVLFEYVRLASDKKILADYTGTLNEEVRNAIVGRIAVAVGVSLPWVKTFLDWMAVLGLQGVIDQRIAYPVKWQKNLDEALVVSEETTQQQRDERSTVENFVQDFGTGLKTITEQAARSIGIDLPFKTIALIGGGLLALGLVAYSQRRR